MKPPILAAILSSLFLALAPAQQPPYRSNPSWQAPPAAAARKNPLAEKAPAAVGGGRKLFLRHCAECHGVSGDGSERAPGLDQPAAQSQSDGALFWKITSGNAGGGMPSWSRLPEAQRWQLVLFLRTLGEK
jgi:mono/diheme cytochrome c family protein